MIRVEFETHNSAFMEPPDGEGYCVEAARILNDAAERIGNGAMIGPLYDINGNRVGSFDVLPSQRLSS